MSEIHTYSPVSLAINWRSEICTDNQTRFNELRDILADCTDVSIEPIDWPLGYGDLQHDNLPLFFQPAAIIQLLAADQDNDIKSADLYVYDDCVAVAHVVYDTAEEECPDDALLSKRTSSLIGKYGNSLFQCLYNTNSKPTFMGVDDYVVMNNLDPASLERGHVLWTARTHIGSAQWDIDAWLGEYHSNSDVLCLGSGNSWLINPALQEHFHRVMLFAQYHAAIFNQYESMLNNSLNTFNRFSSKIAMNDTDIQRHQTLVDHLDYININYSSACYGTQSIRREMLLQFENAWQTTAQQQRIDKLAELVQQRLQRLRQDALRHQNKMTQGLLGFLGALGVIGLLFDLKSFSHSMDSHSPVMATLADMSPDALLGGALIIVVAVSFLLYRNHE